MASSPQSAKVSEHAFLHGLAIQGYRSFYGKLEMVGPLSRVNLLAGQNNAGKSNILRFVSSLMKPRPSLTTALDRPVSGPSGQSFTMALAFPVSEEDIQKWSDEYKQRVPPHLTRGMLSLLYNNKHVRLTGDGLAWFVYRLDDPGEGKSWGSWRLDERQTQAIGETFDQHAQDVVKQVTLEIFSQASSSLANNLIRYLEPFAPLGRSTPSAEVVEAFRQIRPSNSDDSDTIRPNGEGLVRGLQKLERPTIDRQADKSRFDAINRFLRTVLEDDSARLEIPYDARTILVHRGDRALPLEHLGTGIHQVVILASAATLLQGRLICVEEPEVHLHPLLQRKLVRYLKEETSNQYLIATHSAHLLDYENAAVFHVQLTQAGTTVSRAGTPQELSAVCADLGYRPSDLLQANSVIWVEGPSDRIYLQRWIELMAPDLVEGIHFSIMFYGGRLLNHLTADDPEFREFISLRRLNRHIAILVDSDKTSAHARINSTKKRIREEFERPEFPGFAWITACRTIENYVPPDALMAAITAVHPKARPEYSGSAWSDPMALKTPQYLDKVRIAHEACKTSDATWLHRFDLEKRVVQTVDFIRAANGPTSHNSGATKA